MKTNCSTRTNCQRRKTSCWRRKTNCSKTTNCSKRKTNYWKRTKSYPKRKMNCRRRNCSQSCCSIHQIQDRNVDPSAILSTMPAWRGFITKCVVAGKQISHWPWSVAVPLL